MLRSKTILAIILTLWSTWKTKIPFVLLASKGTLTLTKEKVIGICLEGWEALLRKLGLSVVTSTPFLTKQKGGWSKETESING